MSLATERRFKAVETTRQTITSGSATTLANAAGNIRVIVNPASTLAAQAVTFPSAPVDAQTVTFSFGGTMTSGTVVTNFTVVANAGQGVIEPAAPGSTAAGKSYAYRYDSALTKWFRLY